MGLLCPFIHSIETGAGLTAAKLMVGKSMAQSDETYIAKAKLHDAFTKLSKCLNITGAQTQPQPELAKTVVNQQREIIEMRDTVEDLTKRLEIITRELDRLKIRYQYQHGPTGRKLTDEEIDEILERDKKMLTELRTHGYVKEVK